MRQHGGDVFFLVSKKLTWRKEELTGSWRRRGTGRVNGVVLRRTADDSGLVEGDIIPLLPPQEIRSQQEPRPSGERRLFQPRSTGTQMNAFMIRTHTYTQYISIRACCYVREGISKTAHIIQG